MAVKAAKTIGLALLASLVAASAAGCGNPRREGTGTNDGMRTNNYRPFQYGTGNGNDMRLGLDRYRGNDPDLIRDSADMRSGLNRDNGITGYDRDGVNRWDDYRGNRIEVSQQIAEQLAAMDPIRTANVLLTNNNAYVAVTTRNGEDIESSETTKRQIADKVRSIRPEVKNVFVSANPDFFTRVNRYVQDVNAGRPVQGFVEEFNTMIQRLFPTNAGAATR